MLNFPPKSGIKLNDIDIINQKDGILKIEFASDKILLFPQTNFSRSTKKIQFGFRTLDLSCFIQKISISWKKKFGHLKGTLHISKIW